MTNHPHDNDSRKTAVAQCLEKTYGIIGNSSFQHGFSRLSIDVFNQVKYPVSEQNMFLADAHNVHGNNYMRRNMATSAEVQYTIAIKLNKWNTIYYCNRACARTEQRRFVAAIADCKRALALNPHHAKAYARMGLALSLTSWPNRYEEAVQCFCKALELDLRMAESHVNSKPSGPLQITTGSLTSVLKIEPQISGNDNSRILPSTSSAVSDETGHPISDMVSHTTENAQVSQNFLKVEKDKKTNKNPIYTTKNSSNIGLPTSGNKELKQQPEFKIKLEPLKKKDDTNSLISQERVINTPLSTHTFGFVSKSQPFSSYADGSGSNVKVMDAKAAEKLQTNVSILPQHEMEAKSINLEDIPMPSLKDFSEGEKGLQDYCDKLRSFVEQQSNYLEGKGTTQECVNDAKNKTKHADKGKEKATYMPLPERFKKLCGASLQGCDKPSSSLIRPKNNGHSKKNSTGAQADEMKVKIAGTMEKDVKKEKTASSPVKDLSSNKQENREIKTSNTNSVTANSGTSSAEKSQNNSNKTEYYFTVVQCTLILCSVLFYFKWFLQ